MTSTDFVGEVSIFPFNFPPIGFAQCFGQLLAISQNTALFSLLGVQYGGNGTSNSGLPDLQGRVPIGSGNGAGLTPQNVGGFGGAETVTVLSANLPSHTHALSATATAADTQVPSSSAMLAMPQDNAYSTNSHQVAMEADALSSVGGNQSHDNRQPYLAINYCVAMQGIYPARS